MKSLIIISILILSNQSWSQKVRSPILHLDSNCVILKGDTSSAIMQISDGYNIVDFDSDNINTIDSIVRSILTERTNPTTPFECGVELRDIEYNYQLVSLRKEDLTNVVYVNVFASSILGIIDIKDENLTRWEKKQIRKTGNPDLFQYDWHKNLIRGNDGCGTFWGFKIDLTTKNHYDLYISGI